MCRGGGSDARVLERGQRTTDDEGIGGGGAKLGPFDMGYRHGRNAFDERGGFEDCVKRGGK